MTHAPAPRSPAARLIPLAFTLLAFLVSGCAWLAPARPKLAPTVLADETIAALLTHLEAEWVRWGRRTVHAERLPEPGRSCLLQPDGRCSEVADGCGPEQTAALCPAVTDYWRALTDTPPHRCEPGYLDVCETTPPPGALLARNLPWSATFVSAMMRRAGLTRSEFAFSARHADYIADARDGYASAYQVLPTPAPVAPGDLVCAGRGRTQLLPTGIDEVRAGYALHCDVVVQVDLVTKQAEAIGGNVQQTVARITIPLDDEGRVVFDESGARKWALVMRARRSGGDGTRDSAE
jgi:hypothetical protein